MEDRSREKKQSMGSAIFLFLGAKQNNQKYREVCVYHTWLAYQCPIMKSTGCPPYLVGSFQSIYLKKKKNTVTTKKILWMSKYMLPDQLK